MAKGKRLFHKACKAKGDFFVVKHQRGAALVALLAVLMLGASWTLLSRLNAASDDFVAAKRARNAEVLNQAKQALIGFVAAQAVRAEESNPGSLPCPENPGDFDSATGRQGRAGINCGLLSSQKVGRFPWRTLGTDQLVDADGEPLWYVVSRNWGVDIDAGTRVNSASSGLLTVDGAPAVALIIAPGAAFAVPAAPGCAAWNQIRSRTGTPDWRNYLECENATSPADAAFVSNGPSGSFNDQVLAVTAADVLGGIEAAIAARIQREIIPPLSDVYAASSWGLTGRERMFPFAAAFGDPAVARYRGAPPQTQGLLPFNYGEACNPDTEPRCLLMTWAPATPPAAYKPAGASACASSAGGCGYIQTQTCSWDPTDPTAASCDGEYHEDSGSPGGPGMRIEMTATITNVANGLRVLDAWIGARSNVALGAWQVMPPDIATAMNADGSATVKFGAALPNIAAKGWGTYAQYRIRLKVADHRILSTRPRQIDFNAGDSLQIRIGQTVVGAISGASGRVSRVTLLSGTWETGPGAAGTLAFYSVTGSFLRNEDLRVLGVTRARSIGPDIDADAALSWFARNEWYRHIYYAVADSYAWTGSGTCSSTLPVSCLRVAYLPVTTDQTKQRALLILMGRRMRDQTRPSANLADYLESAENRNLDGVFEQLKVGAFSNDRFISISKNP
jgi:hypothetical protein